MKAIPYSLVVGSLMCSQVCTHLDIAFIVSVLGRYLSDLGQSHWKVAKKALRYLQDTKDFMWTYRHSETLGVVSLIDSYYAGYVDDKKSTSGYIFMMNEGPVCGKVSSRHLQLLLLWRQRMWHVRRLLVMQYGCGTSF